MLDAALVQIEAVSGSLLLCSALFRIMQLRLSSLKCSDRNHSAAAYFCLIYYINIKMNLGSYVR